MGTENMTECTTEEEMLLPGEYVNGISGYATSNQIISLHFSTSRRNITCGTGTEGSRFETQVPEGSRAVGFFGTADGGAVTSIGVKYAKLPAPIALANDASNLTSRSNDASNITVTIFEPLLLMTPNATNMWSTNNQTAISAAKALAAKELSPIYANIIANGAAAWVETVPDPVTNTTYYISLGTPDSGTAAPAIWVFAIPLKDPASNISLAIHATV
ncbi:hypothetical protein B0H13DRAFT_2306104 [Mycena leptocephala]|nr:hypothetical protein B0H13DRAFT_2306104 [Mycena leptocephala]